MANQMVSLEANSFVERGTTGASGLRVTIPPPAWAGGRRKERKGSLDARRRVRKADRMPLVLRGCSEDILICCISLLDVNNERVGVVYVLDVDDLLNGNLERMDCDALRAQRRGFRRRRDDDVL